MTGHRRATLTWLTAATLGLTAACADINGEERVELETLHADHHCGEDQEEPRLRVIDDDRQFQQARDALFRHVTGDKRADRLAAPDFDKKLVVLIEMGRRPTGGFSVALRESEGTVDSGTVRLPIEWTEPAADAVVTQAITSPCLVVALPRGDYDAFVAVDQEGATRARD